LDNREAKFILNAYRSGDQDASDPAFLEALEQARRDPALAQWFSESMAFDTAVRQKLCAVGAPSDLRERILARGKVNTSLRWSRPLIKWAIAAGLILTAILSFLIWHEIRPGHLVGWQNQALDVISSLVTKQVSFDAESAKASKLMTWLRAHHAPTARTLPQTLETLQSLGCKTFSWNGTPVSVICFRRPEGGMIHLVMTSASGASNRGRPDNPELIQQRQWSTATWREGDTTYMLALQGGPNQLRSYLPKSQQQRLG
jgi:hypothetical protein